MPKISKLINAFKSCIGKGSNTKKYKTIAEVFHDLRISINNNLNSKNGKDVRFDTVDNKKTNHETVENKTLLHYETNLEVVRDLLKKGINPNIKNKNDKTALEVTGDFEIAKMLLEHGATVYSKQQMGNILCHHGHNQVEKKIIISLLMHHNANTDFTHTNLITQCKEVGSLIKAQEVKELRKQAQEVKKLMYESAEVEALRKNGKELQKLINQRKEVERKEVQDGNQIVSKIIFNYIKNQDLKAQLIHTCQNLGLVEDYSKVATENEVSNYLDSAFDVLDAELAGDFTVFTGA